MFRKNKQKNINNKKGFTLVEMIVSVALFSIVVVVAIGGILTIIDANRKAQTLTLVMNNLNFALETMTRNIKTADPSTLDDSGTINYDGQNLSFLEMENQDGDRVRYFFYEGTDTIPGSIYMIDDYDTATEAFPIISDEVVIEEFQFDVENNNQPSVFLKVKGYAQVTEKTRSDFTVQTTVSPRRLDIGSI